MSEFVDLLNRYSERVIVEYAWPMLWQSTLLILVAGLAVKTVFRKAPAQFRYVLLCAVLLRFLVPPAVDFPTSIAHWCGPFVMRGAAPVYVVPVRESAPPDPPLTETAIPHQPATFVGPPILPTNDGPVLSWSSVVLMLLAAGVSVLFAWLLWRLAQSRRSFARGLAAPDALQQVADELCATFGIRRKIPCVITSDDTSPAVHGFVRPKILLPKSVADHLHGAQMRAVLGHELAHIKRRDYWANWFQVALGLLFFYNPMVWLLNRSIRLEREDACDDLTVAVLGIERGLYAESLLSVAEHISLTGRLLPAQVGVAETKALLERRLRRVLSSESAASPVLSWRGMALIAVFLALFGTWQVSDAERQHAGGQGTLRVRVVDTAGQPVSGAMLQTIGLISVAAAGDCYSWRDPEHDGDVDSKTGADGTADVSYSKQVLGRFETGEVIVRAGHAGYIPNQLALKVDSADASITLDEAGRLRVSGTLEKLGGKEQWVGPVHVIADVAPLEFGKSVWSEISRGGKQYECTILRPDIHYFYLAYRAQTGMYFSDAVGMTVQAGKPVESTQVLKPGFPVSGTIDAAIPRPIKHGIAEMRVVPSVVPRGGWQAVHLEWIEQCPVDKEGRFTFASLPAGIAEIAVYCDGAAVQKPFAIGATDSAKEIVVPMVATAALEMHVETPEGKPLKGARVVLQPRNFWTWYARIAVPEPISGLQAATTSEVERERLMAKACEKRFSAVSDAEGRVVLKEVPPVSVYYTVEHNQYFLPASNDKNISGRHSVSLKPGETAVVNVRMIENRSDASAVELVDASKRVRFDPTVPLSESMDTHTGSSWSALNVGFWGTPTPSMMASFALGGKVPVAEQDKPARFEMVLNEGNDDRLVFDLIAKSGTQQLEVRRDKPSYATVDGIRYSFRFPRMEVGAAVTPKAVTRLAELLIQQVGL